MRERSGMSPEPNRIPPSGVDGERPLQHMHVGLSGIESFWPFGSGIRVRSLQMGFRKERSLQNALQ